jgi:hypothetical protein
MRNFEPHPYQRIIRDHIIDVPRCGVFVFMGAGKGSATLMAINCLRLVEPDLKVLVIGPVRVARDVWPDEVRKWKQFAHLRVSVAVGDVETRRRALAADADLYCTNFEVLPTVVEHFGDNWPFKMVVVDEASKLKGFRLRQGTQRARALAKVAHKHVDRMVLLTGTPAPNGIQDVWPLAWFIDAGQRLGRTFSGFTGRWFYNIAKGDSGFTQLVPHAHSQAEIQERIRDVCLSLNAKDWFDIKDPVRNVIKVKMPAKAEAQYREFERELFTQLQGHDIEAVSAAAKSMKCLQMASGAVYTDETCSTFVEVHDAKLQALESVVEEAAGMPVLVAYHFKSDLARIAKAFPTAANLATDEGMARFKAGAAPLGLAHPASLGHGVDGLQRVTNIVCFFTSWWNSEEHDQLVERVGPVRQAQAGLDRPVFVHYLAAADTVDEVVVARRDSKRAVQDALLDYLKAKGQK